MPQSLGQLRLALSCPNLAELTLYNPPSFLPETLRPPPVSESPPWPKLHTLRLGVLFEDITQYATVLAAFPSVTRVVCYNDIGEHIVISLIDNPQVASELAVLQMFRESFSSATITNRLTQLWESRPSLRLECVREGPGLSQDELDKCTDRFAEVDGDCEAFDRLYQIV